LIALGVQVYEIIRPLHANVVMNIMQQIPNLNINDLQKLDEKIVSVLANATNTGGGTTTVVKSKIDKNKKDLFKKITSPLIGRNVLSRLFRNPGVINDLHPLNNNSGKLKNTNILDNNYPGLDTGTQMQQLFDAPR
jgi:exportin-5